jgi:hypothetical protein
VTQHGCLPSLLGDVDKRIEIVFGEEKNIFYWAKSSKGRTKISCTVTKSPMNQPRNNSFHLYSLSPYSTHFNSQQRPPLSSLSGINVTTEKRAEGVFN